MSPTPLRVGGPDRGRGSARAASGLALGAVVAAILVLTLWPLGPRPGYDDDQLTLRFGLADALRNVFLFLPLGLALAGRGASVVSTLLRAALLSSAIELAQVVIPGRYGNLSDVIANAGGAWLGAAILRSAPRWLGPTQRGADRLALAWSVLVAALLVGTALLLRPALPPTQYWAGWTLELGDLARYSGRVTSVLIGDEPLPNGKLARSEAVRALLLGGAPLRIDAIAGAPTASLAPIFTLHDTSHREILLIGAERGDLVLRVRTLAQAVSLDRPGLRWTGILTGIDEGGRITVEAHREGNGWCLALGERRTCPLGFTLGSGWRLLWFPHALPASLAPWLNDLWLGLLALPLGLWLRAGWRGALALAIAASALLFTPGAGLLPTPTIELVAPALGLAFGAALRPLLGLRSPLALGPRRAIPLR